MVTDMLIGGFTSRSSATICYLLLALLCTTPESVSAQSANGAKATESPAKPIEVQWLTGSQRRTQLRRTIRTSWSDISLAEVIGQIATTQKVNLFLDRRVDKNREIHIPSFNGSVFAALHQVLDQSDLHGVWINDVFYIGSLEQVARLIVTREQITGAFRELPEPVRRKWLVGKQYDWARLTCPDDLMKREFPELNAATLPHDLWPAWSGPEMTRLDLLLLIANGFDLEPSLGPSADEAIILAPKSAWKLDQPFEISISLPRDKEINQREILETIKQQFPEAVVRTNDRDWTVTATAEQLVLISGAIDRILFSTGESSIGNPNSQKVISLKTQASIGGVLSTVAKNLNVELQFDPELRPIFEERIDVDVSRVTYEVLIKKAIEGTGLTFELTKTTLVIKRKLP